MESPIALSQPTFDRFNRASAAVLGGNPAMNNFPRACEIESVVLRVYSSTIGTYGYPAKIQIIDPSTGTYGDDPDRPETVYLIDPAGVAYVSGDYADARFACYRGTAFEAVYEAVKQSSSLPSSIADLEITNRLELGGSFPTISIVGGTGAIAQTGSFLAGVITYTPFTTVGGLGTIIRVTMPVPTSYGSFFVGLYDLNNGAASLAANQRVYTNQGPAGNQWEIVAGVTAIGAFSAVIKWGFQVISHP